MILLISSSRQPIDFIDALVESYKLETSVIHFYPVIEEKKYVPKTTSYTFKS